MTQPESSEEANHFEQVLGRLDALLKRNQPMNVPPVEAMLTVSEEEADNNIPMLTEVYVGEAAALLANARDLPAPLLTEPVDMPEQPDELIERPVEQSIEQLSAEQLTEQVPESTRLSDASFGSVATVLSGEALQPPTTVDSDVVVERTVSVLMPLLQETLERIVGEEIERALSQVRAGVVERLHGEIKEEIEWVLRERLREVLMEGRD